LDISPAAEKLVFVHAAAHRALLSGRLCSWVVEARYAVSAKMQGAAWKSGSSAAIARRR